ncbi:MAG: O-antigen ligase family protein [Thermomicrobiales bacterium]
MIRRALGFDKQNGRIDLFALAGLVLIGCVLAIGLPVPVAALLIAAAAGLATLSPSAALGATLAATPLIFRPIDVGSGSWTLLELMLVAGAVGLSARIVLEILATRSFEPVRAVLPATSIIIGGAVLIALAAFALTNLADAEQRDASVRAVRTIIVEPLVVVPLTMFVLRRGRIEVALGALASAMVISAGWGALGLATGLGVEADGVRRAVGPYTHPNNLAFFLERATLLTALPAMLIPRYRRIGLVLFGIGIAGLLTTFSRGALLGFPAGLVVALWLAGRLRAIAGVVAGLLAAAGAFALLAGDRLFDSGSDGSEPSRLVIWDGAERILRDFPLTGIGPDQFYVM